MLEVMSLLRKSMDSAEQTRLILVVRFALATILRFCSFRGMNLPLRFIVVYIPSI